MEEVAKHNTKTDCWVVVDKKVLNVTKFLKDHPGGELAILTFAGKDATKESTGPKIKDTNINDIPYSYSGSFSAASKPTFASKYSFE